MEPCVWSGQSGAGRRDAGCSPGHAGKEGPQLARMGASSLEVLWWVSYRLQIVFIFLVWHTRPLRRGLCLPAQLSALPLCTQMTPRPGHCGPFQVSCPCHTLTGSLHLCSRCLQHPPLTCLSGDSRLINACQGFISAFSAVRSMPTEPRISPYTAA